MVSDQSHKIPNHVAIIMDGNGRWAQKRGHARVFGHVRGASRVKDIVRFASKSGVKALTLFAFSTENWKRPVEERRVLWKLLKKYLKRERQELKKENIRAFAIGQVERLDPDVQAVIRETEAYLSECDGMRLSFAVSYGSRDEILNATKKIAQLCREGRLDPEAITEATMDAYLWTSCLESFSDVDLLIRTGGEQRLSNFLLWQSSYAEYFYSELCWPEFLPEDFEAAIESYQGRLRKFGGIEPKQSVAEALMRNAQ